MPLVLRKSTNKPLKFVASHSVNIINLSFANLIKVTEFLTQPSSIAFTYFGTDSKSAPSAKVQLPSCPYSTSPIQYMCCSIANSDMYSWEVVYDCIWVCRPTVCMSICRLFKLYYVTKVESTFWAPSQQYYLAIVLLSLTKAKQLWGIANILHGITKVWKRHQNK